MLGWNWCIRKYLVRMNVALKLKDHAFCQISLHKTRKFHHVDNVLFNYVIKTTRIGKIYVGQLDSCFIRRCLSN